MDQRSFDFSQDAASFRSRLARRIHIRAAANGLLRLIRRIFGR